MTKRRKKIVQLSGTKSASTTPRMVTSVDMPKESEIKEEPRVPTFSTDVLGIAILVFLLVGGGVAALSRDIYTGIGIGAITAAVIALVRHFFILDRTPISFHEIKWQPAWGAAEEKEVDEQAPLVTMVAESGQTIRFRQPEAGEVAQWISRVIKDWENNELGFNSKYSLSQRKGLDRGWSREMWRYMIDVFAEAELITIGRNHVPEPTEQGLRVWKAWLRLTIPAPIIEN